MVILCFGVISSFIVGQAVDHVEDGLLGEVCLSGEEREEPADSLERLIEIEWEIIRELQGQLDSEFSAAEKVKISNTLAYHVNTLNKLLAKREPPTEEEGLAELFVKKALRLDRMVRGIRRWIRRRSWRG